TADGVVVEQRPGEGITIAGRVDVLSPSRAGARETDARFPTDAIATQAAGIDDAVARTADRVKKLAADDGAAERALRADLGAALPLVRAARREVEQPVSSPRALFGWLAPPRGDAREAAARLAVVLLAQGKVGRAARALLDKHVAARVTGALDLGPRASVLAVE